MTIFIWFSLNFYGYFYIARINQTAEYFYHEENLKNIFHSSVPMKSYIHAMVIISFWHIYSIIYGYIR